MTDQDIFNGICEILRDRLRISAAIAWDTDLIHDLQLDSVNQLALVVEIENRFRVCFAPGDEQGVQGMREVVALVRRALTA